MKVLLARLCLPRVLLLPLEVSRVGGGRKLRRLRRVRLHVLSREVTSGRAESCGLG